MTEATAQPPLIARTRRSRLRIPASWRAALTPHARAILVVLALALAFYLWTAASSSPFVFTGHDADVYNLLTTAFLHGHTYLPLKVPAGLLHLQDPYDPLQNGLYSQGIYHDLTLFHGRFYSQWGPAPALTLFLPFRVTTLQMSPSFAVALFSFIGLVCAVALLHLLVRRLVPQTPSWLLVVATAGLALTNVAPFLLRRPVQYEVAISGGYCFEMAGILLIARTAFVRPDRRWPLAFGSLCLGLAFGSRPTLAVGVLVAVAGGIYLIRKCDQPRTVLAYALGPFLVCGVLLALYNDARFGSFGDFGTRYVLAGYDALTHPIEQLSYIPPGLFSYLLIPARFALTFPHFFLMTISEYPFRLPAGYATTPGGGGAEPTGGILPTMPITLLLLLLPVLWRRRGSGERPALLVSTGFAALGLLIVVLTSFALWATTQRYEVDFATLFLIPSYLVWAVLIVRNSGRRRARRWIAAIGIVFTVFGAMVGTAVSITGYYDELLHAHPGLFRALEDITSPLATLATKIGGKAVLVRVDGPIVTDLPPQSYTYLGESGPSTWIFGTVTVTIIAPSADRLVLTAIPVRGPQAPAHRQFAIDVKSPGQPTVTVPAAGLQVRLPIVVHSGLNRIYVSLAGPPATSPYELDLSSFALAR